jgi:enoyl-CoA hydratase/carnithine racemase
MFDLLIDPRALVAGWGHDVTPVMLIDLAGVASDLPDLILPPCPLIGLGDPAHPLAHRLDAVVEAPVTLPALIAAIHAQSAAASVLVQLLRGIGEAGLESALVQESIAYGLLQGSAGHAGWLAARPPVGPFPPGIVHVDRIGDRLTIHLDRPAARNAIDRPMRDALHEAFTLAALDPDIDVVLSGEGRAFCVGADLTEFGTTRDPAEAHRIRMLTLPAHAIARCRDRFTVHVRGACVGAGLEMAAFATRVTADAGAWFQLPELAMGLIPGAGGCVSVSRRIGRQRAALMILSGRRISAATALSWGLIDAIDEGGAHVAG